MKKIMLLSICVLTFGAIFTSQHNPLAWPPSGTCYIGTFDQWQSVGTCTSNAQCLSYNGVTDTCCASSPSGTKDCDLDAAQRPVFIVTHPTGNCGVPCWDYWGGSGNFCKGGTDSTDLGFRATASRDFLGGNCT